MEQAKPKPFKLTAPKVSEKDVENQILRYLNSRNILSWKVQTVGVFDPTKRVFRSLSKHQIRGQSDIGGIVTNGPGLAIEVKVEADYRYIEKHYDELRVYVGPNKRKQHFREQIEHIEQFKARGHVGFFTYSLTDTVEKLIKLGLLPDNL